MPFPNQSRKIWPGENWTGMVHSHACMCVTIFATQKMVEQFPGDLFMFEYTASTQPETEGYN